MSGQMNLTDTTLLFNTLKVFHVHHKMIPTTKTSHQPSEMDLK